MSEPDAVDSPVARASARGGSRSEGRKTSAERKPRAGERATLRLGELTLETVAIEKLKQHPSNPRAADPELISQSLDAHGQYRAIVVSKDGFILAGNHTYQAAVGLGFKTMQVHRLGVRHDSKQAIQIMLADNRTSDFSRYDDAVLSELLTSLGADGLEAAAWDQGDLDRLLKRINAEPPPEFADANAPVTFVHTCPRCGFKFDDDQKGELTIKRGAAKP